MKKWSMIALLGLFIGGIAIGSASAKPFNNRGEDWLSAVSPSQPAAVRPEDRPVTLPQGFNSKDGDWLATVSPSREPAAQPEDRSPAVPQPFNRK